MPKVLYLNIDFHPTVRFCTGKSVNNDSVWQLVDTEYQRLHLPVIKRLGDHTFLA